MPQAKKSVETVAIGRIGGAKGVSGGVKVTSYSGEYEHFLDLDEVELVPGDESSGGDSPRFRPGFVLASITGADGVVVFGRPGNGANSGNGASSGNGAKGGTIKSGLPKARTSSADLSGSTGNPARHMKVKIADIEAGVGNLVLYFEGYDSPEAVRSLAGMDIVVPVEKGAPLRQGEWYVRDLVGLKLVASGKTVATVAGVFDGAADPCLEASMPGGRVVLVPFRKEFVGTVDLEAGTAELLAPWVLKE